MKNPLVACATVSSYFLRVSWFSREVYGLLRMSANPFEKFAFGAPPLAGMTRPAAALSCIHGSKATKKPRASQSAPAGKKAAKGLIEKYRSPREPEWPLRIIIVGHNPSEKAWELGHYYGNPSNRMWKLLSSAGIVPGHFTASNDDDCPITSGVGFTDVGFSMPGTVSSEFTKTELHSWRKGFYDRLLAHAERAATTIATSTQSGAAMEPGRGGGKGGPPATGGGAEPDMTKGAPVNMKIEDGYPKIVAFAGKRQWEELFFDASPKDKAMTKGGTGAFRFGRQPVALRPPGWPFSAERTEIFVLPSSSGAAAMTNEAREAPYRALGEYLTRSGLQWTRSRRKDGGISAPSTS